VRVTFTYRGYDGSDHEWTGAWATDDASLATFMAGRAFERDIRNREAMEPAGHHKITITENKGSA